MNGHHSPQSPYTIGVLALQGGFTAHLEAIANLDEDIRGKASGSPSIKASGGEIFCMCRNIPKFLGVQY